MAPTRPTTTPSTSVIAAGCVGRLQSESLQTRGFVLACHGEPIADVFEGDLRTQHKLTQPLQGGQHDVARQQRQNAARMRQQVHHCHDAALGAGIGREQWRAGAEPFGIVRKLTLKEAQGVGSRKSEQAQVRKAPGSVG